MSVNRLVADTKGFGCAGIGVPACYGLQDGKFAIGHSDRLDRRFQKALRACSDGGFSCQDQTDNFDDFILGAILEAHALNSRLDKCTYCLGQRGSSQQNETRFRRPALGFEEHFHSVRAGHIVVQYGTVGPHFSYLDNCINAVRDGANDFNVLQC